MGLRTKSRLRLVVLCAAVTAVVGLGGGTYTVLKMHRTREIQALKPAGLAAYAQGDLVQALHDLAPYVLHYPDDLEALETYAKVRQALPEADEAEIQEAIGLYRRIVALKPQSIADKLTLLKLYSQREMNTETVQEADDILSQLASNQKALPAAAGAALVSADDPAITALREKAEALRHLRKIDDARKTAEALVALNPAAPGSPEELFLVMSTAGDAPESILARLAQITAGHESEPRMMLLKARTYAAVHEFDKARTAALAVVGKQLPAENMVLQLADLLDRLEEFTAAGRVIDAGVAQFHSAALEDEHFRRLMFSGQYGAAEQELSGMDVRKRPLLAGLHVLALCEQAKDREAEGDSAGAAALRLKAAPLLAVLDECGKHYDTRGAGWHDVLELAYFEKKPSQRELIDKSRDALARDPMNPFFYYTLGNAYREAGDDSAAIIQWRSAAALAPSWAKPLARAARYFINNGDPLQALDLAQKADRRLPNENETLVSIAIAWQKSLGAPNVPDAAALLAFILDPAHQAAFGWDENILPMEVWLRMQTHQQAAAEARVNDAIAHIPVGKAAALLPLAITCQQIHLDAQLPGRCLEAYRNLKGNDASLASARAALILDAAGPANSAAYADACVRAKQEFATARESHAQEAPEKRESWDLAWCRLLEEIHDPAAAAAWKTLAAQNPANNDAQWAALAAASVHGDHGTRGEILERLRNLNGDSGLSWRLEKGLWLLEDPARSGNLDEALTLLRQTTAMSPDSASAHHLLGEALAAAGRIPEALAELTRAADLDPRDMQIKLLLGQLYLNQGDKVRAIEQLRRVTESATAKDNQRKQAAVLLTRAGDVNAAMPVLLANEAGDPAIKELVAGRLWQTGDWRGAAVRYADLLKNPTPEIVEEALHFFTSLNEAWATGAEEKAAITQARQAGQAQALAALDGLKAPEALKHAIRGSFEAQSDHVDTAIVDLAAAVKLDPASIPFRRRLITTLLSAGKINDALAAATDAASALPADPGLRALLLLGASGGAGNSPLNDASIREYLISSMLEPASNQDLPHVAELLESAGKMSPGELALQLRLVADRNRASVALQVLAIRKLMAAGTFSDALTLARRAMLDAPSESQPASLAAYCAAQLGKWDEAQTDIAQWKSAAGSPDAAHSLEADFILAMSALRQGRAADAISLLQKDDQATPANHPDHKTLVMLLTLAYIQNGQWDAAEARLWPEVAANPSWRDDYARLATDQIARRDATGKIANLAVARQWLARLTEATKPADIEGLGIAGMAWYHLGAEAGDASAKARGYELLRAAVDVTSGDAAMKGRAAMVLATACEADNDLAGAEQNYRLALKLNPSLTAAANNLGLIIARSGKNLPDAESLVRQAVAGAPAAATYDDSLAFVLRREGKFPDALAAIAKAVALEKSNPEWLLSQAEIQLDAGLPEKARDSLAQFDALSPSGAALPRDVQDRYAKAKARANGSTLTQGF